MHRKYAVIDRLHEESPSRLAPCHPLSRGGQKRAAPKSVFCTPRNVENDKPCEIRRAIYVRSGITVKEYKYTAWELCEA